MHLQFPFFIFSYPINHIGKGSFTHQQRNYVEDARPDDESSDDEELDDDESWPLSLSLLFACAFAIASVLAFATAALAFAITTAALAFALARASALAFAA